MVHHYEYSTINSHHKVRVNLQASNMDALKSKIHVPCSQNCVFTFVTVQEVVIIFCIPLIQVVTVIVQWK